METSETAVSTIPNRRRETANFGILWGGHFLSVFSSMVIAPLLPFYMERLGAEDEASVLLWSGLSLAASPISAALTAPLWGRLGDLTSRKIMVVRALLGSAVVLTTMGFADTPFQLFVLRLFQGALGGVVDAVSAYAASEAKPQEQGRVRGKLEGAIAAGSMLGPLVGGLLLSVIGYQPLFTLLGVSLGLWTAVSFFGLRETRRERASGSAVSSFGMGRQWILLLGDRKVRLFLLAGIMANFGIYGLLTVLPVYVKQLVEEPSHTAVWVGVLQAVNWASVWIASSWWGKRNDRHPIRLNYAAASILCGLAILMQTMAPSIAWLIPLRILQGLASSALLQSVFLTVTRSSSVDQLGFRMGLSRSILFTGQIMGPMASGTLSSLVGASKLFALHGLAIILSGVLVWVFGKPKEAPKWLRQESGF
ncbi:MFS transporter [Paenibacillus ehimensis]|uniref:MFS transporter n=1 Tax=Paenibacillus ehimensis TaxID=79264 RepID=A0ABT8V4Y6_9BACL|nr:MFS transporter [Paenibacillus ehimensis]MDO3676485.1 MFS transporter [Paenibacillus ehimensis]